MLSVSAQVIVHHRMFRTSRGRRTENMPLSCDMAADDSVQSKICMLRLRESCWERPGVCA
jgi:hypothetical protein